MKLSNAPIWSCGPRAIHCRYGHKPLRERSESGATGGLDYSRADGLVPYTCVVCAPHSHAIGVLTRYHSLITFYACSREQLEEFLGHDMTAYEMLTFLGYTEASA